MNPRKAFEQALAKTAMLADIPIDLHKVRSEDLDREILRLSIIAELDAVSLYEQMASGTQNKRVREVLLDVAKEEKTHVGEFQALLLELDPEHGAELEAGKKEVMNPRTAFEQVLARYDMDKLHERIAKRLGWTKRETESVSLQALRDLVHPVDAKLAHEITQAIREGY